MTNVLLKIARISHFQFKCNYLDNEKHFLNFLFNFWNLHQILNILKEKMIVIDNLFPKLQTAKNLVRKLSKTRRFRARFDSQHVKASQIIPKSPLECFYPVFPSFSEKLIRKLSPLVLGEVLQVFANTLTPDEKHCVKDCKKFGLPIKMQLSEKQNFFSIFLFHFWNLHQILNVLKKRMIVIANLFLKYKTVRNLVGPLSKKRRFRTRLDSQHVKASQILAKCPLESFYHVFPSFSEKLTWKMSPMKCLTWNLRSVS